MKRREKMSNILVFDTETTGIPFWKERSGLKKQPHMVQLAAILCDEETRDEAGRMDVIIKPDGWVIPQETIDIHGITNEQAMDEGIPEVEALQMFFKLWYQCDLRIAHNTTFDNRIIRIALKRYLPDLISDELWKNRDLYYCTKANSMRVFKRKDGHLADFYKLFTGKDLENAHNAMADVQACMEIYFAIQDGVTKAVVLAEEECKHENSEMVYSYIPGEAVKQPDHEVCNDCGYAW